ncbi:MULTISPECIES: ATP-binding protein [Halobacterium]|uniref:ATP-binding protein n=1 Tax=Halobacterium TaxID=2239 RepID=UPI0009E67936|nr:MULTISPECIES: ATP-binding protein [Halobacterium]MCG1002490.1 ATP-binding protein [Halobacterium noricense]
MGGLRRHLPVAAVLGLAVGLLAVSTAHHAHEIEQINHVGGPVSAFLVDAVPAACLLLAGYWLHASDFGAAGRWLVASWSVLGGGLFAAITLLTIAIREFEGRSVAEPVFPLLVDTGVGAVAGFLGGVFYVRARRDAERASRASDAFAFVNDVLRHDIRNSLGVVRGQADLLASTTDDESVADRAATIHDQTEEALDRIESADTVASTLRDEAAFEPVDLSARAETAADRVADAYAATVDTDLPEQAPVLANDAVQSVVDNLVENAAEHNDADDPRVEVAVELGGDAVRLEVRDNGPGVAADVLADADGGLDLVRTLVHHYDGDICVTDNDPRGTVFAVDLPRADTD